MLRLLISWLLILLSSLSCFLSAWIILPAPIFALLPLSVGAPEISPWLLVSNLLLLGFGLLHWILGRSPTAPWTPLLPLGLSGLALALSLWPLLQLPHAKLQADRAIQSLLGQQPRQLTQQLAQRPPQRPQVWNSRDSFQGIPRPTVRYTPDIPFAQPDGIPLKLDIYQPPTPGLYPGLIVIYGGAWQRGSPKDYARFSRHMAARGYVIWAIAYRHAPRYRFPSQLEDIQAALRFIQSNAASYETDPTRLAIMGRSAGAQLAMLAAYHPNAPSLRAVINYYGPVNLTRGYYEIPTPDPIDSRKTLELVLGGSPETVGDLYRQASPYNAIDQTPHPLPPTLLIYGDKDRIILTQYGQALRDRLHETGNPAALIAIPWADHAFDTLFNGLSNQFALYYTERFLDWATQ